MTPRIRHLHEAPRRPSARSSRGERERGQQDNHRTWRKGSPLRTWCPARPHPIAEPTLSSCWVSRSPRPTLTSPTLRGSPLETGDACPRAGTGLEISHQVPSAPWLAVVLQTRPLGKNPARQSPTRRGMEGWELAPDLVTNAASSPSFTGRRTGVPSPMNGTTVRLRAETPGTSLGKWLPL
ncbi:unnamed protein product [Rangifer tarandus platyrhynchus]|uniref:Uncharacterized protein n=1 Tax=Rangifer tarandus platyrhynchus TaxID=3082113 RepID=A0AC59Z647_RANTA